MAIPKKVLNFLDKNKIKYKELEHRKVYTAIDKAKTLRIKESLIGKAVVLKVDRDYVVALMSADKIINKQKLGKVLSQQRLVKKIDFAKEKWIKDNLKGAKMGSVPPFGDLWKIPVLAESSFLKNKKIVLNSGDNKFSLEMSPPEFKKINSDLILGNFTKKRLVKKKTKKKPVPRKRKK